MFDVGSYVIYRSEGVCVVSDIREENFGSIGKSEQYYILAPVNAPSSTVFIPVNNSELTSYMRPLLSAKQINELAASLRDSRLEWTDDTRARNNKFKEILSASKTEELIVLVNTLNDRIADITESGRKVPSVDLNILHRAEKILYDQFSSTANISSVQNITPLLRGEFIAEAV